MANKLQVKRTTVSGRTPNTTNSGNTHFIDTGELALNLTDGKMFSSNGTVYFEVGANLANQIVTGTVNAASFAVGTNFIANTTQVTIAAGVLLSANGGVGTAGQVLASNGSSGSPYWVTVAGGGASGSNTQIQFNDSGSSNATSGFTFNKTSNNVSVANSINAASFTTSGLVANTTAIVPTSNTILLGNTIGRFIISANTINTSGNVGIGTNSPAQKLEVVGNGLFTGNFVSTVPVVNTQEAMFKATNFGGTFQVGLDNDAGDFGAGTHAAVIFNGAATPLAFYTNGTRWMTLSSTGNLVVAGSVNAASFTIGSTLIANTTGVYHTGTVNAASFTTSGLRANTTAIVPTSNTILLGNSTGRFVLSANTGSFSGAVSGITTLAAGNTTITGLANISGNVVITSSTTSGNNSSGALQVTGGVGVGDSVYVKNRVGFTNSTNISVVYQVYNVTSNSLDTVFG